MENLQHLRDPEPFKVLGDPFRLNVLRLLMHRPATLTQMGKTLGVHAAQVRYHLKQLEGAGLVELTETRVVGGYVEKYYQATAGAFLVNVAITPGQIAGRSVTLMGSHDLALERLGQQLEQSGLGPQLFSLPLGSLDGLIALRQGLCQLAGCHLLDDVSGEYNGSHVRHLFPGQAMLLVTLTFRQQGLVLQPGNPRRIGGLADLAREGVTFVNRQAGSGTRLWLDHRLAELGIRSKAVRGHEWEVHTHRQVGRAVLQGQADAGIAVLAVARQLDLEFLPLFEERYDLVMPAEATEEQDLKPLLNQVQSGQFRRAVAELGGYDTSQTGNTKSIIG